MAKFHSTSMPLQIVLFVVLFLSSVVGIYAKELTATENTQHADVSLEKIQLYPFARTVQDLEKNLSIEALLQLPTAPEEATDKVITSFGFSDAVYWFRISLHNPEAVTLKRLLVFEPTWLDDVQVTLVEPNGKRQSYRGGDLLPFDQRSTIHQNINFELSLPPGQSQLLVRTQTRDPYLVGMTLWQKSRFFKMMPMSASIWD